MLRMYLLRCWFNLSDEGVEDAIYDSYAMRKFVGIDFFGAINCVMVESGHIMKGGTIIDATIIHAPSSTKNAEKKRDPKMHQTKKGNEWRFGMKCHAGVDAGTGLLHTIEVTLANTHDIKVASKLIRPDDEVVYGNSGYIGIQKRPEIKEDEHLSAIDDRIVRRPRSLPKVSNHAIDWERFIDHRKASIRCQVEHAFKIVKRQFGHSQTAYRGLSKNANRLFALCISANLYMLARRTVS